MLSGQRQWPQPRGGRWLDFQKTFTVVIVHSIPLLPWVGTDSIVSGKVYSGWLI